MWGLSGNRHRRSHHLARDGERIQSGIPPTRLFHDANLMVTREGVSFKKRGDIIEQAKFMCFPEENKSQQIHLTLIP